MKISILDCIRKLNEILSRTQKVIGIFVLLLSIITAALEMIGVSVIIPLVNVLLEPRTLWDNKVVSLCANVMGIETDGQLVICVITFVIFIYLLKNGIFWLNSWIRVKYACKIQRECSSSMMISYMNRGYSFFLNRNVSELVQGTSVDVSLLYNVVMSLLQVVTQFSVCIFIFVFLIYEDWLLAIGVLAAATICLMLIVFVFRNQMVLAGKQQREYGILASRILFEAYHGIKEVFAMRKQKYFVNEYVEYTRKRLNAQAIQTIGAEIPAYIIEAISICSIMVILGFRVQDVETAESFVATLAAFAVGAFRILPSLGKVSVAINTLSASIPGLNSVYENVVQANQFNDCFYDYEVDDKFETSNLTFKNEIRISNVKFGYSKNAPKVLADVSFSIEKGTSVAFIGESGAGKSTLADIVLGVLKPQSGKILLDGIDITDIPNAWSRIVGFVPQSIYLSDTTIRENIAFGVKADEIDDDRINDVLEKASLHEYVNSLQGGIGTVVGDRGVRLSGGQRQRIGIARALYHNPQVLILDEATSALDNDTEKCVMEAVEKLHGTMTMIIIAHRLSTIENCDKIYEVTDGKIVERIKEEVL